MGRCDPKRRRTKWDRRGKSLGGGSFGCLRLKCKASLQLRGGRGGFDLERVDMCHPGLSAACSPGTFLILSPLKWLQMHLKLTWGGKGYILSTTKKVALKKKKNIFSTSSCVAWIGVLISSKQHKELGPACQSWREQDNNIIARWRHFTTTTRIL